MSSKKKQEESWSLAVARNLHDFSVFLYDKENKSVLGRTANNWGQIMIFYACYYSFLAALFAIAITIVLGTLDPYVPRFQTRIQAPGLSIQPREPSKIALTSDIKFSASNPSSYEKYVTQMEEFINSYGNQTDKSMYQTCLNGKVHTGQKFNDSEIAKSCTFFPKEVLGNCAVKPYGYNTSKPCILVKANRIINWFPVGFTDLALAKGNEDSKAPRLVDVLNANGVKYDPYLMYISCYGMNAEDRNNLNGDGKEASNNTKYYPAENPGIPFMYFPYYGKARQPGYRTPVVAVQFLNVQRNVEIRVGCKAYARNIVDDQRMQVGYFNFMLQIDD